MLLFPNRVDNVYTLVMSMAVVLVVPSLSGCMVAFPIPIGYHICYLVLFLRQNIKKDNTKRIIIYYLSVVKSTILPATH